MKNLNKLFWFGLLALPIIFSSCSKNDPEPKTKGKYETGVFITNEGAFGSANGSVSYYNTEKDSVSNYIFKNENSRNLGDVVQSFTIVGEKGFIQVNASNKIEVVTYNDFIELGVINNLSKVRYLIGLDENNAYATMWGRGGKVIRINTNNLSIADSIEVGNGPEGLILAQGLVYVANSGGYVTDSIVSVIDPITNEVFKSIWVGDSPRSFVKDADNNVWVLCYGKIIYDQNWQLIGQTASKLVRINTGSNDVTKEIIISETAHPSHLAINPAGTTLYYGGGWGFSGIFAVGITDDVVSATPLIDKSFYGFNVNPENGNIFALEALTFTENGKLYRYNKDGTELGSYEVGIGPNGASFRKKK